jgi:hypothetical protein
MGTQEISAQLGADCRRKAGNQGKIAPEIGSINLGALISLCNTNMLCPIPPKPQHSGVSVQVYRVLACRQSFLDQDSQVVFKKGLATLTEYSPFWRVEPALLRKSRLFQGSRGFGRSGLDKPTQLENLQKTFTTSPIAGRNRLGKNGNLPEGDQDGPFTQIQLLAACKRGVETHVDSPALVKYTLVHCSGQ